MQALITLLTVVGGLLFSIAIAVVVEEWIFGQIFKIFFVQRNPAQSNLSPKVPVWTRWIAQPVGLNQLSQR
ncbi:MAG TPA: hypothetical protein VJO35_18350 [Terriglobales bacterium]|nr:hypothetical protein [Terriglobales bacterium]